MKEASPLQVIVRVVIAIVVVGLGAGVLWYLIGGVSGSIVRLVIAGLMAFVIASVGIGYFRQLSGPLPPEASPEDVDPALRLAYVCEMCGLELAVLRVAGEKPPKHCGEAMTLIRRSE